MLSTHEAAYVSHSKIYTTVLKLGLVDYQVIDVVEMLPFWSCTNQLILEAFDRLYNGMALRSTHWFLFPVRVIVTFLKWLIIITVEVCWRYFRGHARTSQHVWTHSIILTIHTKGCAKKTTSKRVERRYLQLLAAKIDLRKMIVFTVSSLTAFVRLRRSFHDGFWT